MSKLLTNVRNSRRLRPLTAELIRQDEAAFERRTRTADALGMTVAEVVAAEMRCTQARK